LRGRSPVTQHEPTPEADRAMMSDGDDNPVAPPLGVPTFPPVDVDVTAVGHDDATRDDAVRDDVTLAEPSVSVQPTAADVEGRDVGALIARVRERGFVTTGEIFAALPDLEPETAELAAIY